MFTLLLSGFRTWAGPNAACVSGGMAVVSSLPASKLVIVRAAVIVGAVGRVGEGGGLSVRTRAAGTAPGLSISGAYTDVALGVGPFGGRRGFWPPNTVAVLCVSMVPGASG